MPLLLQCIKKEKEFVGNYRPTSLTSILCKDMESIIEDDTLAYMVSYKLLTKLQHGFVPGKLPIQLTFKIEFSH